MKRRSANILGLAVTERSLLCAQVATEGAGRVVKQLGRFELPEGASFDTPDVLGKAFSAFLQAHHFSASRVVVGLPARWLIAQEKELPPVGEEEAKAIVRLHAERMGSAEKGALAVDVAGPLGGAGGTVLVVAMLQRRLEQLRTFVEAAGLTLEGVTSTSLAVSELMQPASHALVLVGERGAELVVRRGESPRMLRHIGGARPGTTAALVPELRRSMLSVSDGTDAMIVCDSTGDNCNAMEQQLGVTAGRPTLESLRVTLGSGSLNGASSGFHPTSFVPAVALAAVGLTGRLPVDYTRSRLAVAPARRFGRRTMWAGGVGLALVAAIGLLYTTVTQREAEAEALLQQVEERKPSVKAAETLIDRVAYGRTYFETRTPVLDCLRELSQAFNYDEAIFVTNYQLNSASMGEIKGKSREERYVFALADRLMANKNFSNVQRGGIQEGGNKEREYSFRITFQYTPTEAVK